MGRFSEDGSRISCVRSVLFGWTRMPLFGKYMEMVFSSSGKILDLVSVVAILLGDEPCLQLGQAEMEIQIGKDDIGNLGSCHCPSMHNMDSPQTAFSHVSLSAELPGL